MQKINNSAAKVKQIKEKIAERSKFDSKPVMAATVVKPAPELAISITDSSVADANDDTDIIPAENDDDSVVIAKTPKPQPVVPVETFELEKCTTMVFIDLDGNKSEILLDRRLTAYSELQREIAKRTPTTKKMYVIQNPKGEAITARYFIDGEDTSLIRIKEIGIHPFPPGLKKLQPKWEFEDYHEARTHASVNLNKGDSFSDIIDLDD